MTFVQKTSAFNVDEIDGRKEINHEVERKVKKVIKQVSR